MTLKFNRALEVLNYMFVQNFIKLNAAVHEYRVDREKS